MEKVFYKHNIFYIIGLFSIFAFLANINLTHAQKEKQNKNIITLGMSTVLSGPASFLGVNMRTGVFAAIDEVIRTGGINSHEIRLISLDDGYKPTLTIPNMHRLIDDVKS